MRALSPIWCGMHLERHPLPPSCITTITCPRSSSSRHTPTLTHYEIFFATPKTARPGAGGVMTSGSPNVTYRRRLERHAVVRHKIVDNDLSIGWPPAADGQPQPPQPHLQALNA